MSQVRRAACAGLLRGTWRTESSDGKSRRVSIEGLPTHLARRPIEDKVEKSVGHVWAVHLSLHVERNPRAVSAHDAAVEPAAALQCRRFACARLSQPCLPGSCPGVSATLTTIAF